MKRLSKTSLVAAVFALTTFAGSVIAQAVNQDAYHRAKFGRSTPRTEAKIQAERDNTAFRDSGAANTEEKKPRWGEQRHQAKFGRATPAEENRIAEERANTAFRDAKPAASEPQQQDWVNGYHQSKFGRPAPAKK